MSEPTRDQDPPDADEETWPDWMEHCAHCGEHLAPAVRYPVTTVRDADGHLRFYSFCSSLCQAAWEEATATTD
jgi:hypothetical protein